MSSHGLQNDPSAASLTPSLCVCFPVAMKWPVWLHHDYHPGSLHYHVIKVTQVSNVSPKLQWGKDYSIRSFSVQWFWFFSFLSLQLLDQALPLLLLQLVRSLCFLLEFKCPQSKTIFFTLEVSVDSCIWVTLAGSLQATSGTRVAVNASLHKLTNVIFSPLKHELCSWWHCVAVQRAWLRLHGRWSLDACLIAQQIFG